MSSRNPLPSLKLTYIAQEFIPIEILKNTSTNWKYHQSGGNFPASYVSFRGGSGFPTRIHFGTFRVEPPWFMDGFPGLDPIGLDPAILRDFGFFQSRILDV